MCIRDSNKGDDRIVSRKGLLHIAADIALGHALEKSDVLLIRGEGCLMAVSYTHLDVYKRQALEQVTHLIKQHHGYGLWIILCKKRADGG